MRTMHKWSALIILMIFTAQCSLFNKEDLPDENAEPIEKVNFPEGFDFSTLKTIEIELSAPDFLIGSIFEISYYHNNLLVDSASKGSFDKNGKYKMNISLPQEVDSIQVHSKSFGLEKQVTLPINNNKASYDYAVHYNYEPILPLSNLRELDKKTMKSGAFSFMGTFTANGYPNYLFQVNDHAWESLLTNLNQTLPEGISVPDTKPKFLEQGKQSNLVLKEKTNVYVTFAGEGSDLTSSLGYYIYNGSKPVGQQRVIIFPNASAPGSGGSLHSGDKVLLGEFPADTEIGWFLLPNGWNKSSKTVNETNGIFYSDREFNNATNPELNQHMILLKDIENEVLLLGFEDTPRNSEQCDNDFNDVVFYITLDRLEAVDLTNVNNTTSAVDTDGDGILDSLDEFPLDPEKAFKNGGGSSSSGSLAFEDLWPYQGDYDFNDLVIDYQFGNITDANNLVKSLEIDLVIRHLGGSYKNGFAFELPVPASSVESVTGTNNTNEYLSIAANGVEEGSENAVIFIFDDGWKVRGQALSVSITFVNAISSQILGTYPYNPFIVVDKTRGREVHLPDKNPTSKVDNSLFQQGADYSRPNNGLYYRSRLNLPWAINITGEYAIPMEKSPINYGYLKFIDWAKSAGESFPDWNYNLPGYRNYTYLK